jgi:hypothetical protein
MVGFGSEENAYKNETPDIEERDEYEDDEEIEDEDNESEL